MSKIVAGLAEVVLCLIILMVAEPSFSQTPRTGTPVSPPRGPTPSLQQPAPSPNAAPLPAPQEPPSSQQGAEPNPAPGQPTETAQPNAPPQPAQRQPTPARPGKVASRRHHQPTPRRNQLQGGRVGESYVTAWSGPYVIERAHDYSAFVVQGRWYRAQSICPGWEAGERVSLRAGPPGWCALVNRTRHRTCLVSCDGRAGWRPYL
jgi:hypothetical protein